jgi:hypothetical protein
MKSGIRIPKSETNPKCEVQPVDWTSFHGLSLSFSKFRIRSDFGFRSSDNCSADFQVCCVAGFKTRRCFTLRGSADLEVGDTAGLETCATRRES